MAGQEQAYFNQHLLTDSSGTETARIFRTFVETALSGASFILASMGNWSPSSAGRPFKNLPGDAPRILLRALFIASSEDPSAEEPQAGLEVDKVWRIFDFNLMVRCAAFKAAQSGIISSHSALGFRPSQAKFAGGDGPMTSGGGTTAEATEGAGRMNLAVRPTEPFPDTPLASSFMSITGCTQGRTFPRELRLCGSDQFPVVQKQTTIFTAALSSRCGVIAWRRLSTLRCKWPLKCERSRGSPSGSLAPKGATNSEDPHRGGGGGTNAISDFGDVDHLLFGGNFSAMRGARSSNLTSSITPSEPFGFDDEQV